MSLTLYYSERVSQAKLDALLPSTLACGTPTFTAARADTPDRTCGRSGSSDFHRLEHFLRSDELAAPSPGFQRTRRWRGSRPTPTTGMCGVHQSRCHIPGSDRMRRTATTSVIAASKTARSSGDQASLPQLPLKNVACVKVMSQHDLARPRRLTVCQSRHESLVLGHRLDPSCL